RAGVQFVPAAAGRAAAVAAAAESAVRIHVAAGASRSGAAATGTAAAARPTDRVSSNTKRAGERRRRDARHDREAAGVAVIGDAAGPEPTAPARRHSRLARILA